MLPLVKRSIAALRLLAKPAAAGALALLAGAAVWRLADWRLDAEAARQAAAGRSETVVLLRDEWPAAVVPVALVEPGRPGREARRVASVRLNLAIGRAADGDPQPLFDLAIRSLRAIQEAPGAPTEAGAEWAAWLATTLVRASDSLRPAQRVTLLNRAETALATLDHKPRRREPAPIVTATPEPPKSAEPTPSPPATEPAPIAFAEPPPPTALPEPIEPPPEPTVAAESANALEPRQWTAPWRPAKPPAVSENTEIEPKAVTDPAPLPPAGDRELLAEWLRLEQASEASAASPSSASGPTSAPAAGADEAAKRRTRLAALRTELGLRGYGAVDRKDVEAAFAADAATRVALVEHLLTQRQSQAAALLLMLAEDPAGEVRAAAISALGSAASRSLVETAYELATRDADPRVGRLAEPLRQRLR